MTQRLLASILMMTCLSAASCGDDADQAFTPEPCSFTQISEDHVLTLLPHTYRMRNLDCYMELLAADFRFFPDPVTRVQLGVEYWTRTDDSLATARLFRSMEVTKVAIDLDWPSRSAGTAGFLAPRDGWTRLFVNNVFLDVDIEPAGQEANTYRVENQTQRFYFRRGRTYPPSGPADTLMYLVEWHDEGPSNGKGRRPSAVVPTTWSSIKAGIVD